MEHTIGKLSISNNNSKVVTTLCGFRLSDLNHNGKLRVVKIAEYLEWIRVGLYRASKFLEASRYYVMFIRAARYEFHRDLTPLTPNTNPGEVISMVEAEHRISAVGTSSYTIRGLLRTVGGERTVSAGDGRVLVDSLIKVVRIDPKTRKSIPLGEEMQQLKQFCDGTDIGQVNMTMDKSVERFILPFVVLPTHIDFNHHMNQAVYLRFCEDTASLAAMNGVYPSVNGHFVQQNMETCSIYYENECKLGDTVQVETWESAPRQLNFRVVKNEKLLCFVVMTFFE